jgi:hypothetical protein
MEDKLIKVYGLDFVEQEEFTDLVIRYAHTVNEEAEKYYMDNLDKFVRKNQKKPDKFQPPYLFA